MAHKKKDFNIKGINSVIHWELSNIKEVKRDSLQNDRDTLESALKIVLVVNID
jgi:hypothetical protein